MEAVRSEDWTPQTLPSWHHSIYVGAVDPWMVISMPHAWSRTLRDISGLLRMHKGFESGLMQYGLMTGRKKAGK